jgi:exopolyphosphatase/guanosine-5'-triphosphate,3'-diphosphate pyrophosphatase
MKRCAAIDIGTNTILLLIAEQTPEGLPQTIMDLETTTRLGEGLLRTHRINPHAMQGSIDVIDRYLSLCRDMEVSKVVAVGTSSLREARNRSEFLRRVKRRCGLKIEIISGQEEARLSYLAVAKDQKWSSGPLAVIDIGGGSTEWIYGDAVGNVRVFSLNIGSVTLTEQFLTSDPVKEGNYQAMASHVGKLLVDIPPLKENPPLVGIGGTVTTLFSVKQGLRDFDPSRIHYGLLKLKDVEGQIELFKTLSSKERKAIAGLPPERADVIIAGATILLHSLLRFGSNQIWVSCHGLRYGILFERFLK